LHKPRRVTCTASTLSHYKDRVFAGKLFETHLKEKIMSLTQFLIDQTDQYGANIYHPLPIVLEQGEGCWVTDVDGNRYLDMLSAYSAVSHGHRHPRIIAAAHRQLDRLTLTSRAFYNDQLAHFNRELAELCGMDKILPMNSGAEGVETAIKVARKWGYRAKGVEHNTAEILVCRNNFHGRTTSIVGFSSEQHYKHDFGPYTPGFREIPFGDAAALEAAIRPNTVAFLVEPIQGEGGVIVPPAGYLRQVRAICDRHNILLIADEIQVGLGRTGRMFAWQHDDAQPDILVLGKALGGGVYPVSAIVTRHDILSLMGPGEHGSTWGGNPLAAAIAREALCVLQEERLPERAAQMGAYLMDGLRQIDSPYVEEVRGKGLLVGVQVKAGIGGARPFCEQLMRKGLLCKETHEDVIRFAPPLVIARDEIDWALERVARVLTTEPITH
jgi:ornithine--oxo-acid transaminase